MIVTYTVSFDKATISVRQTMPRFDWRSFLPSFRVLWMFPAIARGQYGIGPLWTPPTQTPSPSFTTTTTTTTTTTQNPLLPTTTTTVTTWIPPWQTTTPTGPYHGFGYGYGAQGYLPPQQTFLPVTQNTLQPAQTLPVDRLDTNSLAELFPEFFTTASPTAPPLPGSVNSINGPDRLQNDLAPDERLSLLSNSMADFLSSLSKEQLVAFFRSFFLSKAMGTPILEQRTVELRSSLPSADRQAVEAARSIPAVIGNLEAIEKTGLGRILTDFARKASVVPPNQRTAVFRQYQRTVSDLSLPKGIKYALKQVHL
ncbi:hypothetical protein RvY_08155 [Ramazzottius varieornatus]|uniref:Uncharacterized protein n=1 Tax=Ramazzottius varieornatus TaxID=947166 RepID=A0A1D1VD19_RAMVA|nr:hypothetical protein RvY_08155 [Ramazzottius varieornatus]